MASSRRHLLAGAGAGLGGALAGCLDALTGGDPPTFEAEPARVAPAALDRTGYAEYRVRQDVLTRSVGALGLTREVRVHNWIAEYDRAVDLGPLGLGRLQAAVFAALATPQVELVGRTFNPVGGMSTDELAELVQEHYGGIRNVEPAATGRAAVLGRETTLGRYRGEARLLGAGLDLDVHLYLTEAVPSGTDFVVCVAAHPRAAGRREDAVRALLGGVRHPSGSS